MGTLNLPAPKIDQRQRSINARYDTGLTSTEEYSERVWKILFTLSVNYTKAGVNYFNGERTTTDYYSISVSNEKEEGGAISFMMFSGLGVTRVPQESNRFSRKKMQQVFDEWRVKVEGWLSLADDEAALLLDEWEFTTREKIRPYWNGEKAGLR